MSSTPLHSAARLQLVTPCGELSIIHTTDAVLAAGWDTTVAAQLRLIHPSIRPVHLYEHTEDPLGLEDVVAAYFNGDPSVIDQVRVHQVGGPFTERVWAAIREIPPGETASYTEVAEMAGSPMAFRAAASACATNPSALFVPCHRVVKADGTPGGFRYGLAIKQALLAIEA
ncbi:methylated-DNA--[protein]-cysteine S-methyltransferase [Stomatohabitans albus]|uniref:methylated-DNA--[protein]-cysteine S-methyltransferase n=1 Tax=Stomatohabitans albus TaxID=3110766 RepID=UPI00300C0215